MLKTKQQQGKKETTGATDHINSNSKSPTLTINVRS